MLYRSYDRVTQIAKQLLFAYYGKAADHAYFMGCSEGGREALLVSQRMPLDYDGIVAGDPGFLLGVSFQGNADRLTIAALSPKGADGNPDYSKAFSPEALKLVKDAIVDECDPRDGLKDGIIDTIGCRPKWEHLLCKGSNAANQCLTAAQISALRKMFDGGLPDGAAGITKGYFYNTSVDQPSWRGKFTSRGIALGHGVNSVQGLFSTPYDPAYEDRETDLSKDSARFTEVGALNRADGVMYSSFKQNGGKLLIYTGTADQAFSAKQLVGYYAQLAKANGGAVATNSFARLFLVSGMTHCSGGAALDNFDPLQAVVNWVEQGVAPDSITATGATFPGRSRPLCAFPSETHYKGAGSIEDATSFECRNPH